MFALRRARKRSIAGASSLPIGRYFLLVASIVRKRERGQSRAGALKQSTIMRSIHDRPAVVQYRHQARHGKANLVIGTGPIRGRHARRAQDSTPCLGGDPWRTRRRTAAAR